MSGPASLAKKFPPQQLLSICSRRKVLFNLLKHKVEIMYYLSGDGN
jgi:hypothetical protein